MNHFRSLNTEYLRPSRTLETVIVSKENVSRIFFIYNYEGTSFRVFDNILNLINFFQNIAECDFHFTTEKELDHFLAEVELIPS
jgi:hypothetical protein